MLLSKDNLYGEIYEYYVIYQELDEEESIGYGFKRQKRKVIAIVETEEVAKHFCEMSEGRYDYACYRTDDYDANDNYES